MSDPSSPPPRLAVRAVILENDRLLLVNAFAARGTDLWCAPGGGVEPHASLSDNLRREVWEETGLEVTVTDPIAISEFHRPNGTFHQVEIYFRARIAAGRIDPDWRDPEGVVHDRRFFSRSELEHLHLAPPELARFAFDSGANAAYHGLLAMMSAKR